MDISCLFAWSGNVTVNFRFLQGVGTGGEVPVASAYINEFIGAEKRGKFFLLYEVLFLSVLCLQAWQHFSSCQFTAGKSCLLWA